jgi:hypothetical protein
MMLHRLLGRHAADLLHSRWDAGRFVTTCTGCGREMVKPPGGDWRILSKIEAEKAERRASRNND